MKVKTNLRSGSMLDDAVNEANKAVNQVTAFVSEASTEADKLTGKVVNAANCIGKAF